MAERMGRVGQGGGCSAPPRYDEEDGIGRRGERRRGRGLTALLGPAVGGVLLYLVWSIMWERNHPASSAALHIRNDGAADRLGAIRQLELLGPEDPEIALAALTEGLEDPDARNRAAAIDGLLSVIQHVGPTGSATEEVAAAVAALMTRLDDTQSMIRGRATQALWTVALIWQGSPRVLDLDRMAAAMNARAGDPDPRIRSAAVRGLGVIGRKLADDPPPRLLAALDDESEAIRTAAAQAVVTYHRARARLLPALVKAIETTRPECRPAYLRILEAFHPELHDGPPPEEMIAALAWALGVGDREVRARVATALGEFGPAAVAAAPALIESFRKARDGGGRDRDREVGLLADALSRIAPGTPQEGPAVALLIEALADRADAPSTAEVISAVARFGPGASAALPRLRELADSDDLGIGRAAREAVSAIESGTP